MEPDDIDEHSSEAEELLSTYSWLYNFQMTNLFTSHVFEHMPKDWVEFGQMASVETLHSIAQADAKDDWPAELAVFVRRCGRLRSWQRRCGAVPTEPLPSPLRRGVAAKKQHELERVVPAVRQLCARTGCHLVADIGAGLGHLGECLRRTSDLNVLGLERDQQLVEAACRRRRQQAEAGAVGCVACLRVASCQVSDSDGGRQRLQELAAEFAAGRCSCRAPAERQAPPAGWCLTGLHSCGDLSAQLLRLAVRLPEARALLLLSCCYHKAAADRPLSRRLADIRLGRFALRLACQQSVSAWCRQSAADHSRHAAAAAWRAMLQAVAARAGRTVRERRRHGVHRYACFREYATDLLAAPDGRPAGGPAGDGEPEPAVARHGTAGAEAAPERPEELRQLVETVYAQFHPYVACVEFLTALQMCLQPVLEGLVLLDRVLFLREHGISAELQPLFDEELSPRAWAVIAWK